MEKIMKVEFFKSLGFNTKTDGIAFIKTIPEITEKLTEIDSELVQFHEQKLEDIEELMDKYEKEKKEFIKECKSRSKNKTLEKSKKIREEEMSRLKQEAREEVLQEMKKEKEELLSVKYSKFIVNFSSEQFRELATIPDLMTKFISKLDNGTVVLEPENKERVVGIVQSVNSKLEELLAIKKAMEKLVS